jgi:cystathionine beta-lyase/cystathionine gamma-synthase
MPRHTDLLHGEGRTPGEPLVPSIYLASTTSLASAEEGAALSRAVGPERFYTRWGNPTVGAMARDVARLEGADVGLGFASGMAAISAAVMASVRAGDRIVAAERLYGGTSELVSGLLPTLGVETLRVDMNDTDALTKACEHDGNVLVVVETPSNPNLGIVDLAAVASVARAAGARTLCDNTYATPWCQNPVAHGIDGVVHSATKALGGHSDVIAGVVVGGERWMADVWKMLKLLGGCLSPRDAALVHCGIKTLGVRMDRACDTAQSLADWLTGHPRVRRVHYPGLASHPGHDVARRQMRGFGAMLAVELDDLAVASRVAESVGVFTHAVSLGGVESLVCHPASTTHAGLTTAQLDAAGIAPGMLRLSIGLEEFDDLRDDLARALG